MSTTTAAGGAAASDPYTTPNAGTFTGTPGTGVFEITLTTSLATATSPAASQIVSGTTNIHAETYNGAIPGPTFRLTVGDTVIARLVNNLPHETGIHWHGIELGNSADGTEVTQLGAAGGVPPIQTLGGLGVPAGGTYLYKFKVTRPGIYWYHPHHHHSTNRVFKGLYGMIVVTDTDEETLVGNTLPAALDTKQLVLSDITVCKTAGTNDPATYPTPAGTEWLGSTPPIQVNPNPTTPQPGPTPVEICELPTAVDDHGDPAAAAYAAGDVPSLEYMGLRINEGQTVLTNGVNVGGRAGSPGNPGVLAAGAHTLFVRPGQGLRLQIVNCATTRYFRLRLTDAGGNKINLVRVGGEGGLLDNAVLEGGVISGFDTKYDSGEILLPPSVRADVVAVIPNAPGSVLTLWTRDFQRLNAGGGGGGPWVHLPSVPVMHLEVDNVTAETYSITGFPNGVGVGVTPLRASFGNPLKLVKTLGPFNGSLLDPTTFPALPWPKFGDPATWIPPAMVSEIADIKLTSGTPGINGIQGHDLHGPPPYPNTPHIESSRYAAAAVGRILELTVTNMTSAHHPFHLHGFSMQPISLTHAVDPTFTWAYREFRDSIDVPSNYKLTFKILLDDRTLVDGATLGGWLGRWLFHCHIFFHHHRGMISEFVVTGDNNGKERPYVDVGGSWAYAPAGGTTTRHGTYSSPDGSTPISLEATYGPAGGPVIGSLGTVVPLSGPGGSWSWTYPGMPGVGIYYVYITATDSLGLQGQAVFRLKIGMPDDGSDVGDPHIRTVDGKSYDFQAVGEFTLLRDRDGLEIQTRQTPLETANPITDNNTGLTSSVSVNTAVAARVGSHKISYQPNGVGANSQLQFFLDGKPSDLSARGIDLDGNRVSSFDANGEMGLRVDYAHGAVLIATPRFWNLWFLDIWVSHTHADEGLMGSIPEETWLPTLPSGATVGLMPESLLLRYITLYKTFADAWRVTNKSSLFTYTRGTSTETFTDKDWPAQQPPSILKPQFQIPGFPTPVNIPVAEAEDLCKGVTIDHLNANCVFDVATTGDKGFAKAYLFQQDLRLHASAVQITGDKVETRSGEPLVVTAIVSPLTSGRPMPTGSVTFLVDGVAADPPITLNLKGQAQLTLDRLASGAHKIRASYTSDGGEDPYHSSTSPNLIHVVKEVPGGTGATTDGCRRTVWIWILIALVLIAIAAWAYFR